MRFGCCAGLDKMQIVQDAGYDYIELPVGVVKAEAGEMSSSRSATRSMGFDIAPEAWNCLMPGDIRSPGRRWTAIGSSATCEPPSSASRSSAGRLSSSERRRAQSPVGFQWMSTRSVGRVRVTLAGDRRHPRHHQSHRAAPGQGIEHHQLGR